MSHEVRAGAATRPWRCEMSGFTAVPRWTLNPVPGIGEHEVRIPDELTAASHRLANDSALPLSSVLLTAHAKVLGALSGDRKSTRLNSSHDQISYAVFCLKKKKQISHARPADSTRIPRADPLASQGAVVRTGFLRTPAHTSLFALHCHSSLADRTQERRER